MKEHLFDKSDIKRILVPIDFSTCSIGVLQYAKVFAKKFNAAIQLLHVVQLNIVGEERGIPRTRMINELSESLKQGLKELVKMVGSDEIVSTITIREGRRPYETIIQEARDVNTDLIIIGAQGNNGLLRLLCRNTLTHVIRYAPCPVLLIRDQMFQ